MWTAVPLATLWATGSVTSSTAAHFALSGLAVPIAIIVWAQGLFWLNRLYMRVAMPRFVAELEGMDDEERAEVPWLRGPLESLLVGSLLIALVVMAVWFFAFAENPQLTA